MLHSATASCAGGNCRKRHEAFADLRRLHDLPTATIEWDSEVNRERSGVRLKAQIANPSERIAFFLRARVRDTRTGDLVGPAYWDRNCITLLPGERARLESWIPGTGWSKKDLTVEVTGWNTAQ